MRPFGFALFALLAVTLAACGKTGGNNEAAESGVPTGSASQTLAAPIPVQTPVPLPFTLALTQDNQGQTAAGSGSPQIQHASEAVSLRSDGAETSPCGPAELRASLALATARVDDQKVTTDSAHFVLRSDAYARGGHFISKTHVLFGDVCANHGNDTTASSDSRATGVLQIRFARDSAPAQFYLRVDASQQGQPFDLTLQDGDMKPTEIDPAAEPVKIGGPGKIYYLRASVPTHADNAGGCCEQKQSGAVALDVDLDPVPVAYAAGLTPFIINGIEADPAAYPEVVSIGIASRDLKSRALHCSGIVIAPRTVMTAAHCIYSFGYLVSSHRMSASAGKIFNDHTNETIEIVGYAYPGGTGGDPDFDPATLSNDIGLLYLARPFNSVRSFPPLHQGVPSWATLESAHRALTLVGFGLTIGPDGHLTDAGVKRYVTIPFSSFNAQSVFYSLQDAGGGACNGDSGGASYVSQEHFLAAVTSAGQSGCRVGGQETRIDALLKWIKPRIR